MIVAVVVFMTGFPLASRADNPQQILLGQSGYLVVEGQVANPGAEWVSNVYTQLPVQATVCEPCTQISQGGVVGWYEAGTEVVIKMYVEHTNSWKYSTDPNVAEVTVDPSDPNVFHVGFEDGGGPPAWDVTVSVSSPDFPPPGMKAASRGKPRWNESVADPVNTLTGNFFHEVTDLAPPAGVWGPSWERMYNSDDDGSNVSAVTAKAGLLGPGWSTPFDVSLKAVAGTTQQLRWRGPEGQEVTFLRDDLSEQWLVPEGIGATVVATGSGYDMTFVDGVLWSFDADGVVQSITSPDDEEVVLTYAASGLLATATYINEAGTAWELTFVDLDADLLVDVVSAPGAVMVEYSYTAGRLSAASGPFVVGETPGGEIYDYDGAGRMVDIYRMVDPAAVEPLHVVHNDFDMFSRVDHQWMAGGDEAYFDYGSLDGQDQRITTVTHDAQGVGAEELTFVYTADGRIDEVRSPDTGLVAKSWDRDRLSSFTSRRGARQTTDYDDSLRPIAMFSPDPEVPGDIVAGTTIEWCGSDPNDTRIASSTDADGVVTEYWYDSADTATQCAQGEAHPTKIITGAGTDHAQVVLQEWSDGLVTSVTDPQGVTTAYTWDSAKRLMLSSTDPAGTTYFGYDEAGRLRTRRSPGGVETWWIHDGAGRVISTVGPVGVTRSCVLPACSFGSTPPTGPTETVQYWLDGSIKSRTDADGFEWHYERSWPQEGGWIDITADPDEMSWVSIYDAAGRMTEKREPGDPSDPEGSTTASYYRYGPLGRMNRSVDPTGRQTHYCYDADANMTITATGTISGDGVIDCANPQAGLLVVRTDYDLRGRITRVTDPIGRQTRTIYDAMDRVVEVRGPADPISVPDDADWPRTTYGYDQLGRRTSVTSAGQTLTTTFIDATSTIPRHEITTDSVTGLETVVIYDVNGHIVERRGPHVDASDLDDPSVPATSFEFDVDGRLIKTIAPDGEVTETTEMDAAGRPIEVIDPAGVVSTYEYSPRGDLIDQTTAPGTADEVHVAFSSRRFDGQVLEVVDGNENVTSFDYNVRGDRIARTNAESVVDHWSYDTAGRLIAQTDGLDRRSTRSYDEYGRLDVVTDGAGFTQDYDWFADGLLERVTGTNRNAV